MYVGTHSPIRHTPPQKYKVFSKLFFQFTLGKHKMHIIRNYNI